MSLRGLMRDRLTIQTSEGAIKTNQGALDRAGSWGVLENFKNIRCNVQERNKADLRINQFALTDLEHNDIIYHQSTALFEYLKDSQRQLRIITALNPRQLLSFPVSDENLISIYEFKGQIEQIRHKKRFRLYIIRCERNQRQCL